jgi:sugar/nucleoside kinase (ribokinase family)
MRARPDIAVLGTLTRDTTVYADGSRTENLGGLLYTLTALAALFAGSARIRPVANVGNDLAADARAALDLPGVDLSLLRVVRDPNNHVHLTYHDAHSRDEVLVGLVPPVDPAHALAAADADHYIVNLTSGRDLELAAMQALRAAFRGTIQLDVHSLTLAIAPGGRRVLARPPDWREWLACADWVQMNDTEARLLGDGMPLERFALEALDLGPEVVFVTLGAEGVIACFRQGGEQRSIRLQAAVHHARPFPTGCGDVFGAAFAFARLSGAPIDTALQVANGVAGTKAGLEPLEALHGLRRSAAAHLVPVL